MNLNLDNLIKMIWEYLSLVRVYTKRRAAPPDFNEAIVLRHGASVQNVCQLIHKDLVSQFKYALVWVKYMYMVLVNSIFRVHQLNIVHKGLD
jgi:ribosome-interacting GTPase 1